jgi:capsule polysaccharide modification protein KpsS
MLDGADLIVLCIVTCRSRYCDRFCHFRVHEIPVTALAAAIYESRALKFGNQLSDFWRHLENQ